MIPWLQIPPIHGSGRGWFQLGCRITGGHLGISPAFWLVIITVFTMEMHPATATSGHCTANQMSLRLNCNINNEVTAGRLFLWSFPVLRRGGTHMQNTRIQCPAKLFTTFTTSLELFLKRFEDLRSVFCNSSRLTSEGCPPIFNASHLLRLSVAIPS